MFVIRPCNWTVKGTVNTLCLWKWTELFAELTLLLLLSSSLYSRCLVSFSNCVIVLINWWQDFVSSNSVCNHTCDCRQNWTPLGPITIINSIVESVVWVVEIRRNRPQWWALFKYFAVPVRYQLDTSMNRATKQFVEIEARLWRFFALVMGSDRSKINLMR